MCRWIVPTRNARSRLERRISSFLDVVRVKHVHNSQRASPDLAPSALCKSLQRHSTHGDIEIATRCAHIQDHALARDWEQVAEDRRLQRSRPRVPKTNSRTAPAKIGSASDRPKETSGMCSSPES